ncbi:type I-B CRISPR-associated protein Cas8b1/Cst1 [Clostridium cochlearium]|uniref:CRISPR-associated CXXC_CXXC protein Cst1 n=1 Tax=Clostridium cochlearium TaxID=1494 RepID=A0A239ZU17_CLOCO|nr:type I-B CRISPR-associated protein Cas8b1/Cst1 [Clostridium cochlearium]SNV74166.1 CRISPR-associated CXXC_CXXC protein Cst1 [Clostridium cochlearium]SQB33612.1 CRISPR-associated CXXC_CXXC protein Cst1 [Clostridium cochlearium]STA92272.1 CRISPR-associated CXXC_CXXC protein Cst1 [Clostridium cochlearium]
MKKIAKIKLEKSDWLYNAGIVGICNILKYNECDYDDSNINYVEFESECLGNFEEKYFNYFIGTYEKFTSWYRLISFEDYMDNLDLNIISSKDLKYINKYIENLKNKLKSNSYKSAYLVINDKELDLVKKEKEIKKIKITKKQNINDVMVDIKKQIEIIKEIIEYLKRDEIKRYILAKNIIYDVIQKFWEKVSFLNQKSNNKDMYEEFKRYFLDSTKTYLNSDKEKAKYYCFTCGRKVSSLKETFGLAWINKIGVDMSRKSSHFWNMNGDAYICPICNLVYSCVPAGFTTLNGRGIFINENSSIKNLIRINKHSLDTTTSIDELEEESYFNIADSIGQVSIDKSERETENIQIIKLNSENERRPYTFNIISKEKLNIICKHRNMLKSMIKIHAKVGTNEYINIYREVLDRIYKGKNLFDLISKLSYLKLDGKFNGLQFIEMMLKINNNLLERGEEIGMVSGSINDKAIYSFKCRGAELRKGYENRKALNKLGGVSYRLLNSLKTKNVSRFMDTIINSYMYLNMEIPTSFINVLNDKNKFQTIGYAFLVGLQGEEKFKKSGEEVNNDK